MAFFHYDGLSAPRWAGGLNFILTYTDELFQLSVRNSLALILLPVPLRVLGAFALARLMLAEGRFVRWFRAAIYLPTAIPGPVFALAGLWIFNPLYGPINSILSGVGLPAPGWFSDPQWAKAGLVLLSGWQIGEGFLVCLAALKDFPPELEEAARLDGAGAWQTFRRVLLPAFLPILLLLALRDAILTFQTALTHGLYITGGGPYYATYTLPLFVHEQAFDLFSFGTAGAALWFLYLLTGLVILVFVSIARTWRVAVTEEIFVL